MRKVLSMVLLLAVTLTVSAPASATQLNRCDFSCESAFKYDGYLINPDGSISSVTINEVDQLIFERNKAVLLGENERADYYLQQLLTVGGRHSTAEEIAAFATQMDDEYKTAERGNSSVSYTTYTYSVSVNGTSYQVKRITAHPTTSSNLFHSASVNKKTTSSSVASGVYSLLKVSGSYLLGQANSIIGSCISAYNAFKDVISGFSPTTTVYGITATYVCAALEQVSFYQYLANGYWTPFASTSYVQTAISSTVFSTNYAGGSQNGLNMTINSIQDSIYSPCSLLTDYCDNYYYDVSSILGRFLSTAQFDKKSQVTSVCFFHNANGTKKIIKTMGMLCPISTAEVY